MWRNHDLVEVGLLQQGFEEGVGIAGTGKHGQHRWIRHEAVATGCHQVGSSLPRPLHDALEPVRDVDLW